MRILCEEGAPSKGQKMLIMFVRPQSKTKRHAADFFPALHSGDRVFFDSKITWISEDRLLPEAIWGGGALLKALIPTKHGERAHSRAASLPLITHAAR